MFALISFALAADTVVYSGGTAADALARVAIATGGADAELRAVDVTALMAGRPPTLVSGGHLTVCSGTPSSAEAVKSSLGLAEGAIKYMEFGSARAALDAGIRDLGCLQTPVDPAQASRAWYLLGIVDAAAGDQAASREDFRRARLFDPNMEWDKNFAPSARATFDAIATEVKAAPLVPLTVLPAPADGVFRLDGRPVQLIEGHVGVTPGEHYVQIGENPVVTLALTVDGNTAPTLVLPGLVGPEVLTWAGDGERRAALSAVLVSALGTEGVVYVVNPSMLWRVRLGGSAWDLVRTDAGIPTVAKTTKVPPPPKAPKETATGGKDSPLGPVILGVGGATLAAGGVLAILGYTQALGAYNEAADTGTTDAIRADYNRGAKRLQNGEIIAGVGAAVLATGVVLTIAF